MRIGVFGGSFNPIHNGHIALGDSMLGAMSLDEVWYMVSPRNPLKGLSVELADEDVRLRWVEMALEGHPALMPSDYEFRLPRPSYTWNTLQHLRKDRPADEFVLIIGGDNISKFTRWANYRDILDGYAVAVYPRKGEVVPEWVGRVQNVTVTDMPLMDVSSTMIRAKVGRGEDISPYVPAAIKEQVEEYYVRFFAAAQARPPRSV